MTGSPSPAPPAPGGDDPAPTFSSADCAARLAAFWQAVGQRLPELATGVEPRLNDDQGPAGRTGHGSESD